MFVSGYNTRGVWLPVAANYLQYTIVSYEIAQDYSVLLSLPIAQITGGNPFAAPSGTAKGYLASVTLFYL